MSKFRFFLFASLMSGCAISLPISAWAANTNSKSDGSIYADEDVDVKDGQPAPDGLTNAEEAEAGSLPLNPNTDDDKLPNGSELLDGADAVPTDPAIRWKKAPESPYALIRLASWPTLVGYVPVFLGNDGTVVLEKKDALTIPLFKIWKAGVVSDLNMTDVPVDYHVKWDWDRTILGGDSSSGDVLVSTATITDIFGLTVTDDGTIYGGLSAKVQTPDGLILWGGGGIFAKWANSAAAPLPIGEPDVTYSYNYEETVTSSSISSDERTIYKGANGLANRGGDLLISTQSTDDHTWTGGYSQTYDWHFFPPSGTPFHRQELYTNTGNTKSGVWAGVEFLSRTGYYQYSKTEYDSSGNYTGLTYHLAKDGHDIANNFTTMGTYVADTPNGEPSVWGTIDGSPESSGTYVRIAGSWIKTKYNLPSALNARGEAFGWRNGKNISIISLLSTDSFELDSPAIWEGYYYTNASDLNDHGLAIASVKRVKDEDGLPIASPVREPALLVPCDIVPDLNRDSKIDNLDQGKITKCRPWRWWLNDDADSSDVGDGNTDQFQVKKILKNFYTIYVDGRCDLLDFAPFWLDFKQLLSVLPPSDFTYKFKQEDAAINVVFTDLVKADAGKYLKQDYTTGFGSALTNPSQSANTVKVTSVGVQIPTAFLNKIKDDANKGVILVEGAAKSVKPLVLEIYKGGDKVAGFSFNISIDGVEKMYRWINLRGILGQSEGIHTNTDEPTNYLDKETNGKMFIMVHGFNVNESQSRGWASEAFKRLYQSGSNAMFTGVSWHGDSSQVPGAGISLDYYENVVHAFETTQALASAVNGLKGSKKVIAAHSLGNMVVSSAIKDTGMNVAKYFLLDAAVAIEAYDSSDLKAGSMSPPAWRNYNIRLWAANWHDLFTGTGNDGRTKLTWKDRFGSLANAYNFWSSTEDVLNNANGSVPPLGAEWIWASEEMRKGTLLVGVATFDNHGGWGFNTAWNTGDVNSSYYPHRSPSEANQLTDIQIKGEPFFQRFQSQYNFLYQSAPVSLIFYRDTTQSGGAKLLAEAIPAVSFATGRNEVGAFDDANFDLMNLRNDDDFWPYGDHRWHHSDAKDVAYRYNYKLYERWIELGELK